MVQVFYKKTAAVYRGGRIYKHPYFSKLFESAVPAAADLDDILCRAYAWRGIVRDGKGSGG